MLQCEEVGRPPLLWPRRWRPCHAPQWRPSASRRVVPVRWRYLQRGTGSVLGTCSPRAAVGAASVSHPAQALFMGLQPVHDSMMVRELWKAVHVPCLTFANAMVCLPHTTRAWLERCQSEVGRVALGCHGCVAKEAIQGDMGWSSFEAREARSKISYEETASAHGGHTLGSPCVPVSPLHWNPHAMGRPPPRASAEIRLLRASYPGTR